MPVSKFSTQETLTKINTAIEQFQTAIHEAELAQQAGIPGADQILKDAQQELQRAQTLKDVYFPTGTAPAG